MSKTKNAKKIIFSILVFSLVLAFNILPIFVFATSHAGDTSGGTPESVSLSLDNPLGEVNTLMELLAKIVQAIMMIAIPVIIILFIYAGLKFVMARGNPKEIDEAKEMFKWLVIGTAIILGAELLIKVLENTLGSLRTPTQ